MNDSSRRCLLQSIFDGATSRRSRDQFYIFGVYAMTPGRQGGTSVLVWLEAGGGRMGLRDRWRIDGIGDSCSSFQLFILFVDWLLGLCVVSCLKNVIGSRNLKFFFHPLLHLLCLSFLLRLLFHPPASSPSSLSSLI